MPTYAWKAGFPGIDLENQDSPGIDLMNQGSLDTNLNSQDNPGIDLNSQDSAGAPELWMQHRGSATVVSTYNKRKYHVSLLWSHHRQN